jgi:hypothetical protein
MDFKQYQLQIRTQHYFDTREGWADGYRDIRINTEDMFSPDVWTDIIKSQLAHILHGVSLSGKQPKTMVKESDTPIAEDGHVSIVNEFNPTSDEVKAWNALHKLVTLMESKMKSCSFENDKESF